MAADPDRFKAWFSTADLPTNRTGVLTSDQERSLGTRAKEQRTGLWVGGLFFLAIAAAVALLEVTSNGSLIPNTTLNEGLSLATAFAVFGLFFTWRAYKGRLSHDVAAGKVEDVTGPATVDRRSTSAGRGTTVTLYLRVGFTDFQVDDRLFKAITPGETLTAYFLPESHRLVNLEPVESPPSGPDAGSAAMAPDAVTGPPDGTPLAQAIIGRWRAQEQGINVIMEFRPDDTLVVTPDLANASMLGALPTGVREAMERAGAQGRSLGYHWADADHLAIDGRPGSAQVRLAGGQLIIAMPEGDQHLIRLPDTEAAS